MKKRQKQKANKTKQKKIKRNIPNVSSKKSVG